MTSSRLFGGTGSSPRMRGTLPESAQTLLLSGIIPAYAGNTGERPISIGVSRDHPRVCGEHLPARALALALPGSSPRMRGTPHQHAHYAIRQGIIPAYAGNTAKL